VNHLLRLQYRPAYHLPRQSACHACMWWHHHKSPAHLSTAKLPSLTNQRHCIALHLCQNVRHCLASPVVTFGESQSDRDQEQLHELKRMVSTTSSATAAAATANAAATQQGSGPQELGSAQSLLQRSLSGPAAAGVGGAAAAGAAAVGSCACPELPQVSWKNGAGSMSTD
jgi:hypothetical protein